MHHTMQTIDAGRMVSITQSDLHSQVAERSAKVDACCHPGLITHSTVLSILLTVSSPSPLKCYHHATAATVIPRFHKVYAAHTHHEASDSRFHCCMSRGRPPGSGVIPGLAVSPLPCAKRKSASADGDCERWPHQRALHMCWHIIVAAGKGERHYRLVTIADKCTAACTGPQH
jgi:hypothetical protein